MAKPTYSWKRFWCRREGRYSLLDDGFPVDPESELARYFPTDAVPFESIAHRACLVLLGEPGSGKSTALLTEYEAVKNAIAGTGNKTLWVDLREYSTDHRLSDKVFASSTVQEWRQGTQMLHLFLDSLDESLVRIDNISDFLRAELRELPPERLRLRVACRTADWPAGLEGGLRHMWGDDQISVLELMPLRKIDVIEAARLSDVSPEDFVNAIGAMDVAPLAIRPVTLRFLISAYRKGESLPTNRSALYGEGCKLLCEESSESRRDSRKGLGDLSAVQRFAVASRLAAITQFSNRSAIWTGPAGGDIQIEEVPLDCLVGGVEGTAATETKVDLAAVKETLDTGLFSTRGLHRLGWAHQTYAECLAATYLLAHEVASVRIIQVLLHPDGSGKVVPQLRETAAWLASMDTDLFRVLVKTDPETLLRSDIASASHSDRNDLATRLLTSFESGDILDDRGMYRHFARLAHPDLPNTLRPYLADRLRSVGAREAAVSIAHACNLTVLQGELVKLALDPTEPQHLRVRAACTLAEIGDSAGRVELKPLAVGNVSPDPDDELKGCGLKATWPNQLAAHDLFAAMTEPKKPDFWGTYKHFLASDPVKYLKVEDLDVALRWARRYVKGHPETEPLSKIAFSILSKAIDHTERRNICELVATTLSDDWPAFSYDKSVAAKLRSAEDSRHRVAKAMLPKLSSKPHGAIILIDTCGLEGRDVPWLLSEIKEAASPDEQAILAWIISRRIDPFDVETFGAVLSAAERSTPLKKEIQPRIAAVALNSLEADKAKEEYRQFQQYQDRAEVVPKQTTDSDLEALPGILEGSSPDAFLAIWDILCRRAERTKSEAYEVLHGWSTLDASIKAQILEAARTYLINYRPLDVTKWWKEGKYTYYEIAGCAALSLLSAEAPKLLEALQETDWERWARIVVAYPLAGEPGSVRSELLAVVYGRARVTFLETFSEIIDGENERFGVILAIQHLEGFWTSDLCDVLRDKLTSGAMKPQSFRSVLAQLLDAGDSAARHFGESLVTGPLPEQDDQRKVVIGAAVELINHTPDAAWGLLWPIFQGNRPFGTEVLGEASLDLWNKLTEDQIAEVFVWLLPPGTVGDAEGEMTLSYNVLAGQLASRGTPEACRALRRVLRDRPHFEVLRWYLRDAEERLRHNTWTPLSPSEIIQLATDASARLVRNGDDLVDVVLESLDRLQALLQGETPAVEDLWNQVDQEPDTDGKRTNKVFRPKDESALSNYIKRHLDRDIRDRGIIVNREVEIRRPFGSARGEQTDVHVNVAIPTTEVGVFEKLTVIVEVKGCWNGDLNRAMETQLVERYMENSRCRHGIYLVGWFACAQWDTADWRRGATPRISIEAAQQRFNSQAVALSASGRLVRAVVMNTALSLDPL